MECGTPTFRLVAVDVSRPWPALAECYDGKKSWTVHYFDIPGTTDDGAWDSIRINRLKPLHELLNLWKQEWEHREAVEDECWAVIGVHAYVTRYELASRINEEDKSAIDSCLAKALARLNLQNAAIGDRPLPQPGFNSQTHLFSDVLATREPRGEDDVLCTGVRAAVDVVADGSTDACSRTLVEFLSGRQPATFRTICGATRLSLSANRTPEEFQLLLRHLLGNLDLFTEKNDYFYLKETVDNITRQIDLLRSFECFDITGEPIRMNQDQWEALTSEKSQCHLHEVQRSSPWAQRSITLNAELTDTVDTDAFLEGTWLAEQLRGRAAHVQDLYGGLREIAKSVWPLFKTAVDTGQPFIAGIVLNDRSPDFDSLVKNQVVGNHWFVVFVVNTATQHGAFIVDSHYTQPGRYQLAINFLHMIGAGHVLMLALPRRHRQVGNTCGYHAIDVMTVVLGQGVSGALTGHAAAEAIDRMFTHFDYHPVSDYNDDIAEEATEREAMLAAVAEAEVAEAEAAAAEEAAAEEAAAEEADEACTTCFCHHKVILRCQQLCPICVECFQNQLQSLSGSGEHKMLECWRCHSGYTIQEVTRCSRDIEDQDEADHLLAQFFEISKYYWKAVGAGEAQKDMDAVQRDTGNLDPIDAAVRRIESTKCLPCPGCGVAVEFMDGCMAMVCGNKTCQCHFCYLCNAAVPNEELMNQDREEQSRLNHALVFRDHRFLYVDKVPAEEERFTNVFIIPMAEMLFEQTDPREILQRCLDRGILTYEEVLDLQEEILRKHETTIQIPEEPPDKKKPHPGSKKKRKKREASSSEPEPDAPWACPHCTYLNPPLFMMCGVCFSLAL